jgi:hypothetical protein
MTVIRVAGYGRLGGVGGPRCPEGGGGERVWVPVIGRGMVGLHVGEGRGEGGEGARWER